jgi:leader peptidase (prepilin peptidase) / N-methyltransferase
MGDPSGGMEEEPKELYVEMARLPGLAWKSAAASAALGALLAFSLGWSWSLVFLLPLVPVGVALSVIDWRTKLLPVRIIYPTTAGVIVLGAAVGFLTPEPNHFWRALLGAFIARSVFWLLWFIRSAGMGFGDVRLAAIIGFVLSWFGWAHLFIGLWVGFLAFGVPGLLLAVFRRDRGVMRRAYPFGPFLLGGAVVGVVWGAQLGLRLVGG